MKKLIFILITFLLNSCMVMFPTLLSTPVVSKAPETKYKYVYSLISPIVSEKTSFEDSIIGIDFTFTTKEIGFVLKNKSKYPLRLIWDETSYIDFGKAEKIMHDGVKYTERNNSQPTTLIPPGVSVSDLILPTDNVRFIYSNWHTDDLFPTLTDNEEDNKLILSLKGHEFSVYFSMQKGILPIQYDFKFKIADIQPFIQTK